MLINKQIREVLGPRVRKLRSERGISQKELADMCTCTPSAISQIENGLRNASVESLFSIAQAFGVSIDYLVGKTESPNVEDMLRHDWAYNTFVSLMSLDISSREVLNKILSSFVSKEEVKKIESLGKEERLNL